MENGREGGSDVNNCRNNQSVKSLANRETLYYVCNGH